MKVSERNQKFNEFIQLHNEGLNSAEIISKLGIAANTLYNWRKKLRCQSDTPEKTIPNSQVLPLFTKVVSPTTVSHSIEITIDSSVVIRVPHSLQPQTLREILDTVLKHKDSKR